MSSLFKHLFSRVREPKVYSLVGRSGTGKSYRSQMFADKYHIPLVIDDGLLIKGNKVLAGKSAKQAADFISAMKLALFRSEEHKREVVAALQKERFKKILIIGTGEKMVRIIAKRLGLPAPWKVFKIEEFSAPEEIEAALRTRYTEGKHVIPVPAIEITRRSPSIVYDSMRTSARKTRYGRKRRSYEKTLVKPDFSIPEAKVLSKNTFMQMINQCLYDYDNTIKIQNLEVQCTDGKYKLQIGLRSPSKISEKNIPEIREYIVDTLEKYGSLKISDARVTVEAWDEPDVQEILKKMNEQIEQVQEINISGNQN